MSVFFSSRCEVVSHQIWYACLSFLLLTSHGSLLWYFDSSVERRYKNSLTGIQTFPLSSKTSSTYTCTVSFPLLTVCGCSFLSPFVLAYKHTQTCTPEACIRSQTGWDLELMPCSWYHLITLSVFVLLFECNNAHYT